MAGVDVISVGPLFGELMAGGTQYSVVVIVPERREKDFAPSHVMLDIALAAFMAAIYRTALIIALEELLSRADFWRHADARQILPKRVAHGARKQALDELMRNRGLN